MTPLQRIEDRLAASTTTMQKILGPADDPRELTDDNRTELRHLEEGLKADREQLRLLALAYPDAAVSTTTTTGTDTLSELRAECRLGNYLQAHVSGTRLAGPEAELCAEVGVKHNQIPMELFGPNGRTELRVDNATDAPTGRGINQGRVMPFVFAPSVAGMVGVDMPTVGSGTYSTPKITTSLTAGFINTDTGDRDSSAATITAQSTAPHQLTARLTFRESARLQIGTDSFESSLRENLQMAFSDELAKVMLKTTAGTDEPDGLIGAITADTDPSATNIGFDDFISNLVSGQLDGIFSTMNQELRIVTNREEMQRMQTTFRDPSTGTAGGRGATSIWEYLSERVNMLFFNNRMPAKATNISPVLVYRMGRPELQTAVCPVWSSLTISDPFSDSGSATTHVTMHAWIGDVLLHQAAAYAVAKVKSA